MWHETTMDGKSGVWYYGDETTQNYVTGDTNSGTLAMTFDLTNLTSAALTLDTKYQTENSPGYDILKIMVGFDVLWERSAQNSVDASGSFGWESLGPIPLSSYIGSVVTVSFSFDSMDSIGNDYFGWAIHNIQVGSDVPDVGGAPGPSTPFPDIKANGRDGSVTIPYGTPVSVTIGLDAGSWAGRNADWWVVAYTPFTSPSEWCSYVYDSGWQSGIRLCMEVPLAQVPPPLEVLNTLLPAGDYTFYFAVDENADGIPDVSLLDSVDVKVE